jgi:CopG family nickel-responsive transcriptional regulator
MSGLRRFGVSLESRLLGRFDALNRKRRHTKRSEAIRDLIRKGLVEEEWSAGDNEVVGTVTLTYDHHSLDLPKRLADVQHRNHTAIVATMHVHLDAHNCLEVLVLRGGCEPLKALGESLVATRGVKHGKLTLTTTGRGLD